MTVSVRYFLVTLLVLLQFAAPLLHAHKNSVANFGTSIHLPEFERVNTLLKHAPEFTAPTNHDENIVAISTGIKNETLSFFQVENTVFILLIGVFLMAKMTRKRCYFLFQTEPIPTAYFLNLVSPRAPPFCHVR
ncbi:MAG: hypothetical protein PHQ03_02975 [Methylococcales bacterium]|nr:hypothetical protein [Methylococcales bacterium]